MVEVAAHGAAVNMVELVVFAKRFPAELSGGQALRGALERCLVVASKVMLMRELSLPLTPLCPISRKPALVESQTQSRHRRWCCGARHALAVQSGGGWSIADLVAWARGCRFDFMTLSDHNTTFGHAGALRVGKPCRCSPFIS